MGATEHPCRDWSFETTLLRLHSGRLIAAIRYQPLIDLDTPWAKFGKRVFSPIRRTMGGRGSTFDLLDGHQMGNQI